MTVDELKAQLKNGNLSGVYLFCGEEAFLRRYYLGELRAAILTDPAFDAFNRIVMEGEEIDFPRLSEALCSPPMMADKKLVEWHLADLSSLKETLLRKLTEFCEMAKDYPETVTVFVVDADCLDVGNLPKRPSKAYTELSKIMSVVCFERSGEAALAGWIARHFAHEGVRATRAVIEALLAQSGTSMDALSGEIVKLAAFVKQNGREEITEKDVEEVASRASESDAFGLTNAILEGNAPRAYACLQDMKGRKVEPTLAIASVARTYADLLTVRSCAEAGLSQKEIGARLRMHEYKVGLFLRAAKKRSAGQLEAALAFCSRADTASKTGMGIGGYLALEYLIARTL
ncbi:MAG: DNA polymerase III subunit delta [Clostridia bacterium]|nr:DNA polymerase III subunit delta [Clostridia bacterium]